MNTALALITTVSICSIVAILALVAQNQEQAYSFSSPSSQTHIVLSTADITKDGRTINTSSDNGLNEEDFLPSHNLIGLPGAGSGVTQPPRKN